jgi:CsoR family transcriptional regulator, copper-sensing transcriptional repressor
MAMHADKQEVLNRFHAIERHLDAIREMIEEDRPCLDVLGQTYAGRKTIEKIEAILVENHFSTCIRESISGEREEVVIAELVQLYCLVGGR